MNKKIFILILLFWVLIMIIKFYEFFKFEKEYFDCKNQLEELTILYETKCAECESLTEENNYLIEKLSGLERMGYAEYHEQELRGDF